MPLLSKLAARILKNPGSWVNFLVVFVLAAACAWIFVDVTSILVTHRDNAGAALAAVLSSNSKYREKPLLLACAHIESTFPATPYVETPAVEVRARNRCISYLLLRPNNTTGGRYFEQLVASLRQLRTHYLAPLNVAPPIVLFYNDAAPLSENERERLDASLGGATRLFYEGIDFDALEHSFEREFGFAVPDYVPCAGPLFSRVFDRSYTRMNVWRLYALFDRLAALSMRYTLMLDSDVYFDADVERAADPLSDAFLGIGSDSTGPPPLTYGYSRVTTDPLACYQGRETAHLARCLASNATFAQALRSSGAPLERALESGTVFGGAVQLASVRFFTSPHYRAYAAYVGRLGGITRSRWSDQSTFWPALALFADPASVRPLHLVYTHKRFSAAD